MPRVLRPSLPAARPPQWLAAFLRARAPLWSVVGSGGALLLLTAAYVQALASKQSVSGQLRQRDMDLARLVLKVLRLQVSGPWNHNTDKI